MTNVFMSCNKNIWLDGVESRLAFEFSVYSSSNSGNSNWNWISIARCSDYADANYVNSAMACMTYKGERDERQQKRIPRRAIT